MVEKFTRAVVVLERETYDAKKRVELLNSIHESFSGHLDASRCHQSQVVEGLDINRNSTRRLRPWMMPARSIPPSCPRISSAKEQDGSDPVAASIGYQQEFARRGAKRAMYWLKSGFAFTLPPLASAFILIVVPCRCLQ